MWGAAIGVAAGTGSKVQEEEEEEDGREWGGFTMRMQGRLTALAFGIWKDSNYILVRLLLHRVGCSEIVSRAKR